MGVRSTGSHPTTTQADGHLLEYFRQTFGAGGGAINPSPGPFVATGGVISDYTSGSDVYRSHVFTSSGSLVVSTLGSGTGFEEIEYLVIGGGGGGGI